MSSEDKKEKKKSKKRIEKEEDNYEEDINYENEEGEEEEDEADNSFIDNGDEENEYYNPSDRNMYRNEDLFKERDKKEALKIREEEKGKNILEDEKDENYNAEEKEEEAELLDDVYESDLEVVQEKRHKKKKKLHKVRDKDNEKFKREYDDIKDELIDYNKNRENNESEKEESEIDRNIKKKRNNYQIYPENKKENRRNIDDDFIDYGDRPRHRHEKNISKSEKTQILEQEYISKEDKKIIDEDYPERLLLRFKLDELPTLSQEIKPEVEWICEQKNYNDSPNKKKKITTLLELYKKQFLDIPYIITYKYYLFEHELQIKDLWEIFELDKEYQKLMDLKKKVMNNFNSLESYLNEKIFHNMKEKYIDNAKNIQELNNMMNYINYNKEKYLSPYSNSSDNKNQGPIRKSTLSVFFSENLDKCSKQFCLDSNDIAANIELIKNKENLSKLLRPPEPDCALNELLQNCKSPNLSEVQLMENICSLIGKEMINHPYIKDFVYEYLRNNCYVSTNPTEEGKKQLDVFHPSFRTKRIKEKPIKTFSEDDLFLDVIQREKEKLIEVIIQIKENEEESKEFRYIFSQALNSEQYNLRDKIDGIKQERDDDDNINFNDANNKGPWSLRM